MINVELVKPENINGLLIGQVVKIQTFTRKRDSDPDIMVEGSKVNYEGKLLGITKPKGTTVFYLEAIGPVILGDRADYFELYLYVNDESYIHFGSGTGE